MQNMVLSMRRLAHRLFGRGLKEPASSSSRGREHRDPRQLAAAFLTTVLFSVALAEVPPKSGPARGPTVTKKTAPARAEAIAALRAGVQLDINSATPEDLQLLPRIGPGLAARIVEARENEGPFERVEDLARVRGIGARTLEQLRPLVRVAPLAVVPSVSSPANGVPAPRPETAPADFPTDPE